MDAAPGTRIEERRAPLRRLSYFPDVLTIAIARPTGKSDAPLPIGIAGRGFDGNLTSDSTRMDGYVLSTDLAPTILQHFGIPVPSEMSGRPIRAEGTVDPAEIETLGARMDVISSRRGPVIGLPIVAWLLLTLGAALIGGAALARPAVRLLGLSIVYLPLLLLFGAALEPGESTEVLLVGCVAASRDRSCCGRAPGLVEGNHQHG